MSAIKHVNPINLKSTSNQKNKNEKNICFENVIRFRSKTRITNLFLAK